MKYTVVEWYEDCLCSSGDNDYVVKSEVIEANSANEAERVYKSRYEVDRNNVLRTQPATS